MFFFFLVILLRSGPVGSLSHPNLSFRHTMSEEKCPVIHKVSGGGAGECPVPHAARQETKLDKDLADLDREFDEIEVNNPSLKQYRKLKRVMASITGFYENGTKKKHANYLQMETNLNNLLTDIAAVEAQLAALKAKESFAGHPKVLQYREFLEEELERFTKKKESMERKKQEFYDLHVWSGVINEVCRWLEDNLDSYAVEVIPELKGKIHPKPPRQLTPEEVRQYSKGLDEISFNLKESQDFFQAGVDGRLKIYHAIEQEIIQGQIDALKRVAPESIRTSMLMGELVQDLEYVQSNDDDSRDALARREKMLRNHRAYLKVLQYHTDKLKVLQDLPPPEEREYDPKYTWLSKLLPEEKK